ncbi:nitrite/sulfite reductase [Terrisporobacter sp.]
MKNLKDTKELILSEIPNFKEESLKFLNGEMTKMQYKSISGGYGVYAQRDQKSFAIRLRFSSGIITKKQLHKIYELAQKHNLDRIHLTTRQSIQLHNLDIDGICDIMEEGLKSNIFSRGSGGSYPNNVEMSPLSGVDPNEAFDVAPYAVATDEYFMSQITSYHLPRKLKISYSSSLLDTAHATVQDLGFVATIKDDKPYFKVFVGGGLGKDSTVALELDELIEPNDAIYYVEGLIKLFMDEGDYTNRNKARIRYIVSRLGEDEFTKKFKEYANREKENKGLKFNIQPFEYPNDGGIKTDKKDVRLYEQKQEGYYSVYIHPVGGQFKLEDIKTLMDELDKYDYASIRFDITEGIFIINLNGKQAEKILEISEPFSACTNIEKSVSCIGVPTCQVGIQTSQKMLFDIIDYFKENSNGDKTILNAIPEVYISGCMNSCGIHQIGAIGLTGKKKRFDGQMYDAFGIFIDGKCKVDNTRLGKSLGDFKSSDIPKFLFELGQIVANSNLDFYSYCAKNEDKIDEISSKYAI